MIGRCSGSYSQKVGQPQLLDTLPSLLLLFSKGIRPLRSIRPLCSCTYTSMYMHVK